MPAGGGTRTNGGRAPGVSLSARLPPQRMYPLSLSLSRQPSVASAWLSVADGRMTAEAFDGSGW
jgi:hypothetical protein